MHSQSLGDINHNYFTETAQEVFEKITDSLAYNPDLKNLSLTSTSMRYKVLGTCSGQVLQELQAMQPSRLRAYLGVNGNIPNFLIGGMFVGMAAGIYFNYDTWLSAYLGSIPGAIGGVIAASGIAGYVMDGCDGLKNGMLSGVKLVTSFVMPVGKLGVKVSFYGQDRIIHAITNKDFHLSEKIIKESPKELFVEYTNNCLRAIGFFENINRETGSDLRMNKAYKQQQLKRPIPRK